MPPISDYLRTHWPEVLGIVSTLICVALNIRQSLWGWFWAIVSGGLYAFVYYEAKLYSDMELQFVFIALSLYGWYAWKSGKKSTQTTLPVTDMPTRLWPACVAVAVVFTLVSGYLHAHHTDASVPYLDSALTATSLVAQWQLARKYLQNWLLWIGADVVYTAVYFSRGLHGTALLYGLLTALAVKGYADWRNSKGPFNFRLS